MQRLACDVYLLAAGRGRRAGGPKAWQRYGDTTLLETQLAFLKRIVDDNAITVSIQPEWHERCQSLSATTRWVSVNPDAAPLAAFQELLRQRPLGRWSFVYHVDMPVWEEGLFASLASQSTVAGSALAIVPAFEGRGGHPLLLAPSCQDKLLLLDPGRDRLDHWLHQVPVLRLDLPFPCIRDNWNEPLPPTH